MTLPLHDLHLLTSVCQALYDKKAKNIITIDVRGICSVADYFIVAEGNVTKHVQTLSKVVLDAIDEAQGTVLHIDGFQEGKWIALDAGTLFVHLFVPEERFKYSIERIWTNGKIVDVPIVIGKLHGTENNNSSDFFY